MLVLGIDIETNAFIENIEDARISDIGFALKYYDPYDVDRDGRLRGGDYLFSSSSLVTDGYNTISEDIQKLTGITLEAVQLLNVPIASLLPSLSACMERADFILTHNGSQFDLPCLANAFSRYKMECPAWQRKSIDSLFDVRYPEFCKYKNLTYLSGYYNVSHGGHRAIFDVYSTFAIFEKQNLAEVLDASMSDFIRAVPIPGVSKDMLKGKGFYFGDDGIRNFKGKRKIFLESFPDLQDKVCIIPEDEYINSRGVFLIAEVPYKDKELAKEAGFRWDPKKKIWYFPFKEALISDLKSKWEAKFKVKVSVY